MGARESKLCPSVISASSCSNQLFVPRRRLPFYLRGFHPELVEEARPEGAPFDKLRMEAAKGERQATPRGKEVI